MLYYWTAIVAGFVGSFHCIGMCGPIAMAIPVPRQQARLRLMAGVLYNLGRITTYGLLGALAGLLGEGLFLAGSQRLMSVLLGSFIILMIVLPAAIIRKASPNHVIFQFTGKLKQQLRQQLGNRSLRASYLIGTLNGLLPCGLVYLGVAAAVSSGSVGDGAIYMMLMGLGTLPTMLTATYLGSWISLKVRSKITAAVPVFVCAMGLLLILRGMALDIPYLSPLLSDEVHSNITICR